MMPARPSVLTDNEHVLLGQLVEIVGLTEYILAQTAERFNSTAADKIRRSTGGCVGAIWSAAIGTVSDLKLAALIPLVKNEIEEVAEERNDFIHALFAGDYAEAGYMQPGYQTTSARRSKTGNSPVGASCWRARHCSLFDPRRRRGRILRDVPRPDAVGRITARSDSHPISLLMGAKRSGARRPFRFLGRG
jgi:hypothetical protein